MNDSIIKTLRRDVLFALNVPECEHLRNKYFTNLTCFTRKRKLSFVNTVALMLRNDKHNLTTAVSSFFMEMLESRTPYTAMDSSSIPTSSAFCQQSVKIKPEFFRDWMKQISRNLYEDVNCHLWHGMIHLFDKLGKTSLDWMLGYKPFTIEYGIGFPISSPNNGILLNLNNLNNVILK